VRQVIEQTEGLPMKDYDEDAILFRYVWGHCRHLMTDLEQRADRAAMARAKLKSAEERGLVSPSEVHEFLGRMASQEDPAVDAELADGLQAFRQRVVVRLLSDLQCQMMINRCPRCRRIARTPTARQCPWCKHDWHDIKRQNPGSP
jgi:hypothetical protein